MVDRCQEVPCMKYYQDNTEIIQHYTQIHTTKA